MRSAPRVLVPAVLLALLGLLPARAQPQAAFHLESRLPAATLAFGSIEEVHAWGPRFEATAIGKMVNDPEMQAFLAPVAEAIGQLFQGGMGEVPPFVVEALGQLQHLHGQVGLALVDVDLEAERPHLVLSMDFGDHLADFTAFLDRLRREMDPDGEEIQTMERDGRTWWKAQVGPMPVYAASVDTAFVAATDEHLLSLVLSGGPPTPLSGDADFQTVRNRVGGADLGLFLYGNVDAALLSFGGEMRARDRRIANALGLDTVASVAYGMSFKGDGFRDTVMVHAPDADHGIVPLLSLPPLTTPRTLDLAPASTFLWAEGKLPLDELIGRVRSLVGTIDPDATEEMDRGLGQANQFLGVNIEREVLAGLSGTYGYYGALGAGGGLFPEVAVVLGVKDAAAYEAIFERLAAGIAGAMNEDGEVLAGTRTMEYHGTRMHLFEMQKARGDDVVPFTPTWALIGDRLVITLVPYTMKEIILRVQGVTTQPGLATQEDFQALMALKPATAGAMSYVDLKAVMALLYDTGVPLLQTVAKPNVLEDVPFPLDWALLPPASRVAPYFRSMASYVTWNEDGLVIDIQGPIPLVPLFLAVAAAGGLFLTRAMPVVIESTPGRMPPAGIEAEMDLELARIQAEMILEAVAFFKTEKNRLPTSLEEVVEAGLMGSVPEDPWGGAYRMRERPDGTVVVESSGPDGTPGTPDDVRAAK